MEIQPEEGRPLCCKTTEVHIIPLTGLIICRSEKAARHSVVKREGLSCSNLGRIVSRVGLVTGLNVR